MQIIPVMERWRETLLHKWINFLWFLPLCFNSTSVWFHRHLSSGIGHWLWGMTWIGKGVTGVRWFSKYYDYDIFLLWIYVDSFIFLSYIEVQKTIMNYLFKPGLNQNVLSYFYIDPSGAVENAAVAPCDNHLRLVDVHTPLHQIENHRGSTCRQPWNAMEWSTIRRKHRLIFNAEYVNKLYTYLRERFYRRLVIHEIFREVENTAELF